MNKTSLITLAALLLSGCAHIPIDGFGPQSYSGEEVSEKMMAGAHQPLDIPQAWMETALAGDQARLETWTLLFGGALEPVLAEALKNNYTLALSREAVERADTVLRQSRSSLLPSLSGNLSTNGRLPLEGGGNSVSYSDSLSASYDIDWRGVIDADIRGADADYLGSQALLAASRQDIAASTAIAWISLIEAKLLRALTNSTLDATLETDRIVQARYEAGFASYRDSVLSRSDLATGRDALESADATVRTSQRTLEAIMGRYPGADISVPDQFPALPAMVDIGAPADILRRRPDIVAAEYDVISAFANIDRARGAAWPSLSLTSGLDGGGRTVIDLLDPADLAGSLGLRLAGPIFDGGLRKAQVDSAESSGRTAITRYGQAVLGAFGDVENAIDQVGILTRRRGFLQIAKDAAEESLRLTELRYQEGDTDLLDVLSLRQRALSAQRALISNQSDQLIARVRLYQALGGTL